MVVMRPVALTDVDAVAGLAAVADFGLTTLPKEPNVLARRIRRSQESFQRDADAPEGEVYLFVLEDSSTGQVAGTGGIVSRVGGFQPFYMYRVDRAVHESRDLQVRREIRVLELVAQHDGPAEVGTLFLSPGHRGRGLGRLISRGRFLFMDLFRGAFADTCIAELRGLVDESGRSPFWEAVGRHFFEVDFPKADYLSARDKKFIAELMPRDRIYIPLLPAEARAAIGAVNPSSLPAQRILEEEGFAFSGAVDIFDAGPILQCPVDQIGTVRAVRRGRVAGGVPHATAAGSWLVAPACERMAEFRAGQTRLEVEPDSGVALPEATRRALRVEPGQEVSYVPARLGR